MRITWYGHAAFLVETQGVRIILDPFRSPDSGGYEPIDEAADLVVVSHENDRYHSHLGQIVPPFEVLRALDFPLGGVSRFGITFEAIPVYESPEKKAGDEVTIIHFRSESLHVVFLGDLGHSLEPSELEPLRSADVVLIPAGGPPTIDFPAIPPLLEAIGPKLVLPMHYKTPKINLKIQPLETFLAALPAWPTERLGKTWMDVDHHSLSENPRIVILDHAR